MTSAEQTGNPKQWLEKAIALHESGQFDDAIGLYHKVLEAHPGHAGTLHLLGMVEHQTGQHTAAINHLKKAVGAAPANAVFAGNLGVAYKAAGDNERAVHWYRKALGIDPSMAPLHNNLGVALQDSGDQQSAAEAFNKALALQSRYPEAHANLGLSLLRLGEAEAAISHLRRAIAFNPNYAKAHANLGQAYFETGHLHAAIESLHTACSLRPTAGLFVSLGEACHESDRFDEAIAAFSEALALEPGNLSVLKHLARAEAKRGHPEQAEQLYRAVIDGGDKQAATWFALAGALLDAGKTDEAMAGYRQAVKIDPDHAPAHRMIAHIMRHEAESPDIAGIRQAFARTATQSPHRVQLGFALGKVEEDLENYADAFAHFAEANRLHRRTLRYDPNEIEARADAIFALFNDKLFAKYQSAGASDTGPVFVLGMPRSGTTLTEQILASHSEVYGAGELRLISSILGEAGLTDQQTMFSADIAKLPSGRFAELGRTYLSRTQHLSPKTSYIINKMPGNFWRIGIIRLMLPGAKIIHCRRNPADTCLSIFKNYFSVTGHRYAYDLTELGKYYAIYQKLMRHWHKVIPGAVYDLDYESLVADQESESRKLLDHLGLNWEPAVLDFHSSGRTVKTASVEQVRRPIYASSIDLSARYGTLLEPLFKALKDGA